MADFVIIAVVIVLAAIVIRNYIAKRGHSDCCGTDDDVKLNVPKDRDASHYAHAYTIKVDGMSCDNCAHRVANELNAHEGWMAQVDLAAGIAHVRTMQPAGARELAHAVRNAGYGAGAVTEG